MIGMFELRARVDVPYRVVINEAVDLCKRFGATDAHKYINAVLDRARSEIRVPAERRPGSRHEPATVIRMSLGEFDIIARYFASHDHRADVLLGVGDDAAVLDVRADRKLVVAIDTIVEGVHFPADIDASASRLSRARGQSERHRRDGRAARMDDVVVVVAAKRRSRGSQDFASGLFELAEQHDVALVGGDTVRGPLVVTDPDRRLGRADRWLTRSGAQPGDLLLVSGVPGEAAAGLARHPAAHAVTEATAQLQWRFLRPDRASRSGVQLRAVATRSDGRF